MENKTTQEQSLELIKETKKFLVEAKKLLEPNPEKKTDIIVASSVVAVMFSLVECVTLVKYNIYFSYAYEDSKLLNILLDGGFFFLLSVTTFIIVRIFLIRFWQQRLSHLVSNEEILNYLKENSNNTFRAHAHAYSDETWKRAISTIEFLEGKKQKI